MCATHHNHRRLSWSIVLLLIFSLQQCTCRKYVLKSGNLRFQNVIASPNDHRTFKHVTLGNGLQVLLGSDPHGDVAAAAMDVAAGSLDDPPERQGLAHFLEHMLFLGSEKYPHEADFKDYLQLRGGGSNAFTDQWHTNFHFSVQKEGLEGALDRLAQFFIAPLLQKSPASREVEAVNNEHKKNLLDDNWVMWQMLKHLADPCHPFHKFSTGSKETLSAPNTVGMLRHFFQEHYTSASRMRLVVIGQESVAQLGHWAEKYFSAIPDRLPNATHRSKVDVWSQTGVLVRMQPVADRWQLHFVWELPQLLHQYEAMVPNFISYVLKGSADGSLYQSLKLRNWVESVSVETRFVRDFTMLHYVISLTSEGWNHQNDVVRALFGYLNLLKDRGLHCHLWQNKLQLKSLKFRFLQAGDIDDFVSGTATKMQYVHPSDALGSPAHYRCDRKLLRKIFDYLTPQRMLLLAVAPSQRNLPLKEPIYGTRYAMEPLPGKLLAEWARAKPHHDMALPEPSRFFPQHFKLYYKPRPDYHMQMLLKRPGLQVWHQPSQIFAQPKAMFTCQVYYPAFLNDDSAMLMLSLYGSMLSDILEGPLYQAVEIGMQWSISGADTSLALSLNGFSSPMGYLLRTLLASTTRDFRKERFRVLQDRAVQNILNKKYDNAFNYIWRVLKPLVFESPVFSPEQQVEALKVVTFEAFQGFITALKDEPNHVVCFGFGNLQENEVTNMANKVVATFQGTCDRMVPFREILLTRPGHDTAVQVPAPNPDDLNSVLLSTYQFECGSSLKDALTLELAQFITDPEAFNILRTKEQLGYVVFTAGFTLRTRTYNLSTYHVLIQSSDYPPEYLDERAEAFLQTAHKMLEDISDADLEHMKRGLLDSKFPKPVNLADEYSPLWQEISRQTFNFDRKCAEAAVLHKITKHELATMFKRTLIDRRERRKTSILIYGSGRAMVPAKGLAKPREVVELNAVRDWQSNLAVLGA